MKLIPLAAILLTVLLLGCNKNKTQERFELSHSNKLLVKGELHDTIPVSEWKYYDEAGSLLVKKTFYNSPETVTGQVDIIYFDKGRLVYFNGRHEQSSPSSDNWGKVITNYYCGNCHQENDQTIAASLESMTSYGKLEFYQRLTKTKHFKESESKIDFSKEAHEGFNFLTREDTDEILEYIKSNSVLPVE